ncbi:transcription antitermination factor NusB [Candidatus Aerophobetes bacterium]|nr:transcription antitermination factor NusB [Candidatus Aerophobetes bacterium]
MKNRRKARELSLQVLYQADVRKIAPTQVLKTILSRYHFKPGVESFSRNLILGIEKFLPWINTLIKRYAKNWTLDRMAVIDRNILRISIYELLLVKKVPPVVSINEAVEIAKRYGTEDSGKFVNGILDKIRKERVSEKPLKWNYFKQKLQNPFLKSFSELKKKTGGKAYLVGGFIRDSLLGKEARDFDIVLESKDFEIVEKFAHQYGKHPVVLDDNLRRVILPEGYQMDFSLQKASLESDLEERDFTIDALALDTNHIKIPNLYLIDIKGGLEDLCNHRIALMNDNALDRDPLRMLRAIRLKLQLSFEIDRHLLDMIFEKHHLIDRVAKERIREEIFLILKNPAAGECLNQPAFKKLMENALKNPVYPENIQYLERIISPDTNLLHSVKSKLVKHLERRVGNVTHMQLLKLISLIFSPFQKEGKEVKVEDLALSKKEKRIIGKVISSLPTLEKLTDKPSDSSKLSAFFLQGGEETPQICLLAVLARKEDASYLSFMEEVLSIFFEKYSLILQPPRLVSGNELIDKLGIKPGPQLNIILNKIHQAQITGEVKKKDEALQLARQLLEKT